MFNGYNKRKNRRNSTVLIGVLLSVLLLFILQAFLYPNEEDNDIGIEKAVAAASWGISFQTAGIAPVPNLSAEELLQYNAYFHDTDSTKKIYLTFDCGYENGNTSLILDTLKKHSAPATFFVVGPYIEENPELLMRMVNEGHNVGNHTFNHPDVTQISFEELSEEITSLETLFFETTGFQMSKFFRPPEGKFSSDSLKSTNELGYKTIFWSLAYRDWNPNDQPSKEYAFEKLLPRIHGGAIVLLHVTSSTNAEILDELLTEWKAQGYTFSSLDELGG